MQSTFTITRRDWLAQPPPPPPTQTTGYSAPAAQQGTLPPTTQTCMPDAENLAVRCCADTDSVVNSGVGTCDPFASSLEQDGCTSARSCSELADASDPETPCSGWDGCLQGLEYHEACPRCANTEPTPPWDVRRFGSHHVCGESDALLGRGGTNVRGPLHNRSVAHPFLLAAFLSKFIGEQ